MLGLYVHVPFCRKKCCYCSFITDTPRPGERGGYLDALEREIRWWGGRVRGDEEPAKSVFLGGGTPSLLGPKGLAQILTALRENFTFPDHAEWTCEMNPESAHRATLETGLQHGLNRLSLGVQSFDDTVLAGLDRLHGPEGAREAYRLARSVGYDNISIDLIFGTPGQSMEILERDLDEAIALEPDHISIYGLTVDEGTALHDRVAAGRVAVASDELAAEMYERIIDRLTAAGFRHYEVSNFAQPGRESVHNRHYWRHGEYLGFGPAAHAHRRGERWRNTNDLGRYLAHWNGTAEGEFREEIETLTPARRLSDTAILGLRTDDGIPWPVSENGFHPADIQQLEAAVRPHLEAGWLEVTVTEKGPRLRLTRRGLLLANEIFVDLLLEED